MYPLGTPPNGFTLQRKDGLMRRFALLSLVVAVNMATPATSVAHATDPPVSVETFEFNNDATQVLVPTMGASMIEIITTLNQTVSGAPTRASPSTGLLGHDAEDIAIVAIAMMDNYWLTAVDLASTSLASTFIGALMAPSTSTSRVLDPETRCRRYGADISS